MKNMILESEELAQVNGGRIYADRMAGEFYLFDDHSDQLIGIYSSIIEAQWNAKHLHLSGRLISKEEFNGLMGA